MREPHRLEMCFLSSWETDNAKPHYSVVHVQVPKPLPLL